MLPPNPGGWHESDSRRSVTARIPGINEIRAATDRAYRRFQQYAFWPQFCQIPVVVAVRQAITEMKRHSNTLLFTLGSILVVTSVLFARQIGDLPAIPINMNESDIESGRVPLDDVVKYGETLIMAVFNRLDGAGRPATTADGQPRTPRPGMLRTTGPDAHSCASCHNRPRPGGGGDFATNVFVSIDSMNPAKESISPEVVNERMTVSLFGAGPIEALALEMTRELQATKIAAINQAFLSARNVPAHLAAKGIEFGDIVAHQDGTVDTSGVRGVSPDLVIRPFHQNGAAVSLRQFTNEGMNQHMGMQSQELFGIDTAPDGDGVMNELTVGDLTAIALFQAQLGTPTRIIPGEPVKRKAAADGEALFSKIGCTECHVPAMTLN